MKNFKIVYVLGSVILVGLVAAVAFNCLQRSAVITKNNSIERPVVTEEKKTVTEKTVTEKTVNDNITAENFYKVRLRLNPEISEPKPYIDDTPDLAQYLADTLQTDKPISRDDLLIVYDSTQKSPYGDYNHAFNNDYFILLKPGVGILDLQKTYKTTELSATVSMANPKLLPFIQDSSYCEVNTDCSVGGNFCSYASYNKFRIFIEVFGCEYANYPQENEKELLEMCPVTDPNHMVSSYEVKYTGSKCINNKCVAQNRKVKCVVF